MSLRQNLWVPSPQLSSPILQPWLVFSFVYTGLWVQDSIMSFLQTWFRTTGNISFSCHSPWYHCARICGLWRCVSSQLPSPSLTVNTRDFIGLTGLYTRVHWKCRMSTQLSDGCVVCVVCVRDWALHGCYTKICTEAKKSLLWSKCGFAPDQISPQVVLICDLSTENSTQIYYRRSWDGLL